MILLRWLGKIYRWLSKAGTTVLMWMPLTLVHLWNYVFWVFGYVFVGLTQDRTEWQRREKWLYWPTAAWSVFKLTFLTFCAAPPTVLVAEGLRRHLGLHWGFLHVGLLDVFLVLVSVVPSVWLGKEGEKFVSDLKRPAWQRRSIVAAYSASFLGLCWLAWRLR